MKKLPRLDAGGVSRTGATLTLSVWPDAWWYKADAGPDSGACSSKAAAGTSTAALDGLTAGTAYEYTAYMDAACSAGIASAAFTTRTVTGTAPTFGAQTIADQTHDQHSVIAAVTLPAATGGDGTLTYALTPGLPAGLKFSASTRRISGTPTAARAETTHTYTATDGDGDAATLTFDLTVNADTAPALSSTVSNQSYRQNVQIPTLTLPAATGGNGALTYSLTPALPAGLTFSASTRRVTGIPTVWHTAKTYSFTATDADGDSDSQTFTITVASWTTLTVSSIGATGATLTIGNHGGAWRYKYTSPNGGTCSSEIAAGTSSATVSTLTADTAYTFKAYSDGTCSTLLATASSFTTLLAKVSNVTVSARDKSLAVTWDAQTGATGYEVQWKSGNEEWSAGRQASVASGESHTIPTLTNATEYTVRVRWKKGAKTGEWSDEAKGTPADETLTVSNIGATGATLTIGNHGGAWRHKYTSPNGGTCSPEVAAGTSSATVSTLTADTAYTFKAYSDGTCATELATAASFTTLLAKVSNVSVSARDRSLAVTWDAQTGADGYDVQWKSGNEEWSSSRQASATGASHTIPTLTNATEYTVRVRSKKTTGAKKGEWSDDAKGTPADETLTVSAVGATGATLTIGNYGGSWHYKHTTPSTGPGASCSATAVPAGTDKTTVSGLTADTAHVFKAYSDGGCATELAAASSFTTLLAKLANVSVSARDGSLAVSWDAQTGATGYDVEWRSGSEDWDSTSRRASVTPGTKTGHTIPTLTNGTEYTVRARSTRSGGSANTGEWSDEAKGTPGDERLEASDARSTTATLTLSNWGEAWWWRLSKTAASSGAGGASSASCKAVAKGTASVSLSSLEAGAEYTANAYSDAACSALLASATFTTPALSAEDRTSTAATLRLSDWAGTWRYKETAPTTGTCSAEIAAGTETASLSSLTAGRTYAYKAYSDATCASGKEIAEATFTTPKLAAEKIGPDRATLRLTDWSAAWRYKRTAPTPAGTCSAEIAAGTGTASLSSLTAGRTYAYKAYSDATCASGKEIATAAFATPADSAPAFGTGVSIADRTYTKGAAIQPLLLPAATGGNAPLTYSLARASGTPALPDGLAFDAAARTLRGTPTGTSASAEYVHRATDIDGDAAELRFDIEVTSDVKGLTLTPSSLDVAEGGDATYKVRLDAQPAGTVTVAVARKATGSQDADLSVKSGSSLRFTTGNWSTGQTVTLAAARDDDHADGRAVFEHTPSGGGYGAAQKAELTATEDDDDTAAIVLTPALGTLAEGGASVAYTVRLATKPSGAVTVAVASGDATAVTVSTASLSFTTDNWSTARTVTLTPKEDDDQADESVTIAHTASGADYAGVAADYAATVTDNDAPAIVLTPALGTLAEGGSSVTYTVKLATEPSGAVAVAVASGDTDAVTAAPASLSFTAATWSAGQTVTLTPRDDADGADESVAIAHTATGADYAGVAAHYAATVTDDEAPTFGASTVADQTWTRGKAIADLALPAATGGVGTLTYALARKSGTPALPDGLAFAAATRTLSGTPTTTRASADHVYTATDSGSPSASATLTFRMAVEEDSAPTFGDKTVADQSYGQFKAISSLTLPSATGGNGSLTYTLAKASGTPALPAGLAFAAATRVLSGTPTGSQASADYAYTATDRDGSTARLEFGIAVAGALTVSAVEATTATLTLANRAGDWHYKRTSPTGGTCSAAQTGTTASLTGLEAGTTYAFKAYGDGGCATEIAAAAAFLTKPGRPTGLGAKARDGRLAVSWTAVRSATGYKLTWKSGNQQFHTSRRAIVNGATEHTIGSLTNGTEYTLRLRATNGTGDGRWSATAKGTPNDETLTVSGIASTGATLTIGNYGGAWHYKHTTPSTGPGASCSATAVPTGTDKTTVSGLAPDASHVFKAYSDGACATELATASSFTTLMAKVSNVGVSARDKSLAVSWTAQSDATGYDVQWKSGSEEWDSTNRQASATGASHTIPTLTNSTQYSVRVRSKKTGNTGEWSDAATGTPADETLTVSNVASTGATLTIGNYGGSWHYKHTTPSSGTCSSTAVPAGTDRTTVSGLAPDTAHTFAAYSDGGCTNSKLLATAASFTTLLAKVSNVSVSARNKSLAVAWDAQTGATGYDVQWKSGNEEWSATRQSSATGTAATIATLTNAVEYTVRVRWKKDAKTGEWSDDAKGTPADETLTVSNIGATGATLTIGNYGGSWYHKHTTPSNGTCSSAVSTASATVSGLDADTAHVFKAYSDGGCATELATASSFTTLMAKVAGVSLSARDGSLAATWTAQADATGYDVQSTRFKTVGGDWDWDLATRIGVATNSATIPNLTNATEYAVRARSKKTGNTGEWSDAATATPAAAETLTVSDITSTGATLTVGNHGGAWYYKHTTPSSGTCSSTAVPAGTDRTTVSGLSPDTAHVFKAYSDSGCATELATASSFTTLMAKVAGVSVSARDQSLAATWTAQSNATGYDVQWKSGGEEWDSANRQSSVTGTAAAITTLTNATEYTIRVRSRKTGNTGEWSDEAKGTPADETLTVSNIASTGATLTIGNYGGSWHYKHTTPSSGTCSSAVATASTAATGLDADTAHVFKAYSDGNCSTLLAIASSFTTLLAKVANVSVSARDQSLAVSWDAQAGATGYDVQWKSGNEDWSSSREASVTSGESHTIPTLTNATEYTVRVRSKKSGSPGKTGEWSDQAKGTPADETLTVSAITSTGATLTIGNHGGAWRYKYTSPNGGTCSSEVAAGTSSATVSTLTADTAYTFKAYSDGTCATELATAASFTTLMAKVSNVSVSARDQSLAVSWDAGTGATGYDVQWKSDAEDWDSANRQSSATGTAATISTLTNAVEYTIRVRSKKSSPANTGEWSDAAKGTPADETLTVSNIASTGATLTIGNHGGSWRYKHTTPATGPGASCSSTAVPAGTDNTTVSGLSPDTSHTFKAYSDGACATELATAAQFTTLLAKVANVSVAPRDGSLAVSWDARTGATGYDVQWKSDAEDWDSTNRQSSVTGTSAAITTLTNDTEYTIRVRSKKSGDPGNTGEWSDEAKGTPADETLTVSNIASTGATLTIGNYGGAWHYKHTTPSSGTCSSAVATASTTVSGLDADTAHVFKAYSDGGCATELAAASSFTTLMAKVSNVSVSARDGALAVSWDARTGATGYDVQWKSDAEDWDSANRQTSATGTAATISTLTNATEYTIRVRSKKTGNTGEWSDAAKGTPAAETLTVSAIASTGATLTIGNYGGSWHYRHTTPSTGTCSSPAVTTASTAVTGLDADTSHTFKAYSDSACTNSKLLAAASSFTTLMAKVSNVSVSARDGALAVSWDARSNATGYDVEWKSGAEEWDSTNRRASATGASHTIPTLTNAVEYTIRVRSRKTGNTGEWSDAAKGAPADETLTVSAIGATGATLTIGNYGGAWHHKHTTPSTGPGASCSSAAVPAGTDNTTVSGLTADTAHVFKAYSDGGCATELAAAASFTTLMAKLANVRVSARDKSLAVSWDAQTGATGYDVQWRSGAEEWDSTNRQSSATGTAATITTLTNGTEYTIRARSKKSGGSGNTGEWSDEATGTPGDERLEATDVRSTTATLALSNWGEAWWWRLSRTASSSGAGGAASASCGAAAKGTAGVSLSSLEAGTEYTANAYSDAACSALLAGATFTTPELSAEDRTATAATLRLSDWAGTWRHKRTAPTEGTCSAEIAAGTETASLSSLTAGRTYAYKAYSDATCASGKEIAEATFATPKLAAEKIGPDRATLRLTDWSAAWRYKKTAPTPAGTCSAEVAAGTATAALTTLAESTAHVYKAYSDAACASGGEIAEAAFSTPADSMPTFGAAVVADREYVKGADIGALALPAATGGDGAAAYSLSPAPPAGLSFDAALRQITGAPTAARARTTHTYAATDRDGDAATLTFDITVFEGTLSFSATVADRSYTKDAAIAALQLPAAAASTGSPAIAYALAPNLPAGLSFDASTRRITGAPTAASAKQAYALTATAANYSPGTVAFDIEVVLGALSFSAAVSDQSYEANTAIADLVLPAASASTGSPAIAYALTPAPPAGLSFDASTRTLSGAPAAASASAAYTLTATAADYSPATLTFDIAVSADATAPAPASATADGATVSVAFGEALDASSVPPASAFDVRADGWPADLASSGAVSVSGSTLSLSLASAVAAEDRVTVGYAVPASGARLRDAASPANDAAAFSLVASNATADSAKPALAGAAASGTMVALTFGEPLDETSVPPASAFAVEVGGSAAALAAVDPVSVSGRAVSLALASAAPAGAAVEVAYSKPGTGPIRDAAGNGADAFSAEAEASAAPSLAASDAAPAVATLTLTGRTGAWWLSAADKSGRLWCRAQTGPAAFATGLEGNRTYVFEARAAAGCGAGANAQSSGGALATGYLTTPGPIFLAAENWTQTDVTLWFHGVDTGDGRNKAGGFSVDVYPGHYEYSRRRCVIRSGRTVYDSRGLSYHNMDPGTRQEASAHWGRSCNFMDRFATVEFETLAADAGPRPALSFENVGDTSATLRISNWSGPWWHQVWTGDNDLDGWSGAACVGVAAGTATAVVSGLDANTTHVALAWSDAGCGTAPRSVEWVENWHFTTTGPVSVGVGGVTSSSLEVSLDGRAGGGAWSYVVEGPGGSGSGGCRTAAGGATAEVSGLAAGTRHEVYAFDGASCPRLGAPERAGGGSAWDAAAAAEATTAEEGG